jgi:hypothetical protein
LRTSGSFQNTIFILPPKRKQTGARLNAGLMIMWSYLFSHRMVAVCAPVRRAQTTEQVTKQFLCAQRLKIDVPAEGFETTTISLSATKSLVNSFAHIGKFFAPKLSWSIWDRIS